MHFKILGSKVKWVKVTHGGIKCAENYTMCRADAYRTVESSSEARETILAGTYHKIHNLIS